MKTSLRLLSALALGSTAFAADPEPNPATNPSAKITGNVTVDVDVNGKKETRTFNIDKATLLNIADGAAIAPAKPASVAPVLRPWLGLVTDEPSDDVRAQISIPDGTSLVVRSVVPDSPAAKAGLEKNDLLLRLDDQILTNTDQLHKLIGTKKEGDTVHLTYLRKGHEAAAEARLASQVETETQGAFELGKLVPKGLSGEIQKALKPLIVANTITLDKDGHLAWGDSNKGQAAGNVQIAGGYFMDNQGKPGLEQATRELEMALRRVGTAEEVIAQVKKALADAAAPLNQWATDGKSDKFNAQIALQKAAEDIRRAVEQVWSAQMEAALRSIPDAPATPAPQPAPKAP